MLPKLPRAKLLPLVGLLFCTLASCKFSGICNVDCDDLPCRDSHTRVCREPTVDALAQDVDHLENHIDKFGSVVAMQPSVWGQARLTKYREEFEKEMVKDFDDFKATLQGSITRSDQILFANSAALSAAISGPGAYRSPAPRVFVQNNTSQAVTPDRIDVPDATLPAGVFAGFDSIQRTAPRAPLNIGFTKIATDGISLEPTIYLDQKARYLDHLNQIRRNNEGDDTADSPGYSLNLVRIPVSALPGKSTDIGYGAEITFTLTPHLSEDLLPATFRHLVSNDLVDLLALPAVKIADSELVGRLRRAVVEAKTESIETVEANIRKLEEKIEALCADTTKNSKEIEVSAGKLDKIMKEESLFGLGLTLGPTLTELTSQQPDPQIKAKLVWNEAEKIAKRGSEKGKVDFMKSTAIATKILTDTEKQTKAIEDNQDSIRKQQEIIRSYQSQIGSLRAIKTALSTLRASSPRQRVALLTLPPSQLLNVLGRDELAAILDSVGSSIVDHSAESKQSYLLDARSILREELNAAYELLQRPDVVPLWSSMVPAVAKAVREQNEAQLATKRSDFKLNLVNHGCNPGVTTSLAWAIVVESALLNEQLVLDVKEAGNARGTQIRSAEGMAFFLPAPTADARQVFNEYVRCRWPIHVFALDPMSQDQNLADAYSRRQEMQMALSLAFVSGNVSARNMTRFARRIEEDMETIAINRTQVGFSHGADVFGWRFYPRFQTPEFESNAKSLIRDQLIGGPSRNAEMNRQRLEPGMRECVAIVMMPSFVPYVKCESSSNWFKLTNPKHKEFRASDAVRLGRTVKSVQTCWQNVNDANCHRDGDVQRLMAKVKQLESRLPLQDMMVQVPFENTLGGFEMFNNGVTDLAPQLRGWYGGPGIKPDGDTILFLVGDHFSVHQTKVIAGGKEVEAKLLSRQLMMVTVPKGTLANVRTTPPSEVPSLKTDPCAKGGSESPCQKSTAADGANDVPAKSPAPAESKKFKYVDVHVATPYGVTSHLEIPQLEKESSGAEKKDTGLSWNSNRVEIAYVADPSGIAFPTNGAIRPAVALKWDKKLLGVPAIGHAFELELTLSKPYGEAKVDGADKFDATPLKLIFPVLVDGSKVVNAVPGGDSNLSFDGKALLTLPSAYTAASIVAKYSPVFGPKNVSPPVPVMVTKAVLSEKASAADKTPLRKIDVSNELTISWVDAAAPSGLGIGCSVVVPPAPCPPATGPWIGPMPANQNSR